MYIFNINLIYPIFWRWKWVQAGFSHPRILLRDVFRLAGVVDNVEETLGDVAGCKAVLVIISNIGTAVDRGLPPQLYHRARLSDRTTQVIGDALRHRTLQDGVGVGRRFLLFVLSVGITEHDSPGVAVITVVMATFDRS